MRPFTSQPPSVLVALVEAANRSEPEFGSDRPMQKHNSPLAIFGTISRLTSSWPYFSKTGPLCRSATQWKRTGARTASISSVIT